MRTVEKAIYSKVGFDFDFQHAKQNVNVFNCIRCGFESSFILFRRTRILRRTRKKNVTTPTLKVDKSLSEHLVGG